MLRVDPRGRRNDEGEGWAWRMVLVAHLLKGAGQAEFI